MKPLTKIQKSAKGEDCALRIPGVCNFDPTTTVLCHAPYPGRGGSRKQDWWAAYGCYNCHQYMDSELRTWTTPVARWANWATAIHETQAKLIEKGLMTA